MSTVSAKAPKLLGVDQNACTLYSIGPCNLSTKAKLQVQYSNPNNFIRHHICSNQLTHCITPNPVPLCQHNLGMKRNTKSNYLIRIYIL